jgi:hypothetical protein
MQNKGGRLGKFTPHINTHSSRTPSMLPLVVPYALKTIGLSRTLGIRSLVF